MPAVFRPALTSATRRTLITAFERETSINFCKLRTLLRSPSPAAVKIRCRSRRTSSSAWRQSIDDQPLTSSSGPFTTATPADMVTACAAPVVVVAMASNLSFGSGAIETLRLHKLTWPRQHPFGSGISPYPAGYPRPAAEEPLRSRPGFPSPFGIPAFASWPSCSRTGDRRPSRSAHRTAPPARTLSGFPRSTRVRHDRVGCPLNPGDGGVLPVGGSAVRPAPAASQRPAPTPR